MGGAPIIRTKEDLIARPYLANYDSFGSAHVGVAGVAIETCMPMRCGKHYGCQGTRARCVGHKPTNTNPCPRVGYPALGAGHARDRGGFVHHSVRASHPTQSLAVNLYVDAIKFAHLQHQVSFHDLVAPVVHLTTDARCRRGRSHEQSAHQQETAGDH